MNLVTAGKANKVIASTLELEREDRREAPFKHDAQTADAERC